jgi:flagellar hook protein FlgE
MGALSSGVTGLKVHQSWLDVTGDNLANLNTVAFKGSNVTFSELLSQTVRQATGPVGSLGGTNPQQLGSGVGMSGVTRNMNQGNISATGQDLDVAIDGSGYFVLNNGTQDVYTRMGSFGIDSQNTLVDPATGYKVQRIGTTGESDGFQIAGDSSIRIPWDAAMRANPTSSITINGNLRSSAESSAAVTQKLTSNLAFTTTSGASPATTLTAISALDQFAFNGDAEPHGTIAITGLQADGVTPLAGGNFSVALDTTTVQDMLTWMSGKFPTATATLNSDGEITLTSDSPGYSQVAITGLTYTPAGTETLEMPTYFDLTTVGGNDSKTFNITIYDPLGSEHVLDGVFVKTDTSNTWDLVIRSISGEVAGSWASYDYLNSSTLNRRISGIQFGADGSFAGLAVAIPSENLTMGVQFTPGTTQNIIMDLGTVGEFTGLTQFDSSQSSAAAMSQNGYEAGTLASVSIDADGTVVGTFTNGVRSDVAAIQLSIFQNANGLEAIGSGYYLPTANSGTAVATMAASGGAGSLKGKSLEMSNVDVATQFVNLMQAQNGFQSNARTIRVANDLLRELTNLIR